MNFLCERRVITAKAGTLTAGNGTNVTTSGSIQYVRNSSTSTSWTFQWTPPATSAGSIAVYVTGGGRNTNASNSYVLTPVVSTPGTLTVSPSSLTFTVNGAQPPAQTVQATSSGAPIAVTTSVSTNSGGNWLTATPPGGNTPLPVTVGITAAGLATGTYQGTVSVASASAANSPQTVGVTVNVIAPVPPSIPTLNLGSTALNFSAPVGGTAPPQNVQVTSSNASPLVFTAAAATASGGNWLSASPASGTTPATESISVDPAGLAAGTYQGTVTFTSAGAGNSPSLSVTLTVRSQTPPPQTRPVRFSFNVRDRQSGGSDRLLVDGTGSIDSSGQATGSGSFTRYRMRSRDEDEDDDDDERRPIIVASGTWTVTSVTSFTPVGNGRSGGVLELKVELSTRGGSSSTGSMTIASTGSESGVTLSIDGGGTFVPTGIGRVAIRAGGTGSGDDDDEREDREGDR